MMKKFYAIFCALCLGVNALATELVIGATPVPFGEILEFSKPLFKEKGYELKITEFTDYSIPNKALNDGELDANLFQHNQYLQAFNAANNTDIVPTTSIAVIPMGVYSNKIKDIKAVPDKASVAIPNDPTNESRALEILQKAGLIVLDEKEELKTPLNIKQNPKNLRFKELKAAQLTRALDDVDLAVINANYALDFGLNPLKDSIYLEEKNSPYANFVAVRKADKDNEKTKIIDEVLHSEAVKNFILEKYQGNVIPTF